MEDTFTSFLKALRTPNNHDLLESIHQGYQLIFSSNIMEAGYPDSDDEEEINRWWENLPPEEKDMHLHKIKPKKKKRKAPKHRDPDLWKQAIQNIRTAHRQPPEGQFWPWVQAEYKRLHIRRMEG